MRKRNRLFAALLVAALLVGMVPAAMATGGSTTNIAQGKAIESSDHLGDYTADKAVDGDTGTASRWVSAWDMHTQGFSPKVLTLDLGEGKAATGVASIVIRYFSRAWATDYTIDTAPTNTDSTVWTNVYTGANLTGSDGKVETVAYTNGSTGLKQETLDRYVRFRFTGLNSPNADNNGSIAIIELEINGVLVDASETPPPAAGALPDDTDLCRPGDAAVVVGSCSNYEATDSRDQSASGALDGTLVNWWATDNDGAGTTARWLAVDLGVERNVNRVVITWEKTNATAYSIQKSSDGVTWTDVATRTQSPAAVEDTITFDQITTRYLRLHVTAYGPAVTGWYNIAVKMFQAFGTGNTAVAAPSGGQGTPDGNLCRPSDGVTVTATADSNETNNFTAPKAIDGSMTGNARWASAVGAGDRWLQVDLGAVRSISIIKLFWQHDSVTAHNVKISVDGTEWTTVKTHTGRITELNETVTFTPQNARYVKITATGHDNQGSAGWNNVSLWEVEVYRDGNALPMNAQTVLGLVELGVENGRMVVTSDIPTGYTVTFGANYEQMVAEDGTVYTPLVNTSVKMDVTVTSNRDTSDTASAMGASPKVVVVPGVHAANEGNPKPAVVPELTEWYSSAAQEGLKYTLTSSSKIIAPAALSGVASELHDDIQDLFGLNLTVAQSGAAAGDIILAIGTGAAVAGYDDETYKMEITDRVTITGSHATGVYWGTRSILQALVLSGDMTAPQGTAKDYPEFKVRGFIHDVGRKAFSLEYMEMIVKNMAWYKLNDYHVHINDNLIFMEDYGVNTGNYQQEGVYERANRAYSAFRLESGLPEEDGALPLAAADYHYTKADYQRFTQESAAMGVNVVTEIDVPAHAKAITDAFPSLRLFGCSGHPWNDHLDLSKPESTAKTQEIFADYIKTKNGAYDPQTSIIGSTVHFGADEYYADHSLYRKFVKDMIAWLKNIDGVTPRVWGSLTSMSGGSGNQVTKAEATGVQMNVWSTGWAAPKQMFDLGFDLINCLDGANYIVPAAGYYGDKFGSGKYSWDPNNFGGTWIPASSSQMAGGAYAIWNDAIDTRANGIDERDEFERFFLPAPFYACALWGRGSMTQAQAEATVAVTGYAPNTNPAFEVDLTPGTTAYASYDFAAIGADVSGNGHNLSLVSAALENKTLRVSGGSSYAETGLDKLGWGNKVSFWVNVQEPGIIMEADAAYDEYAIRALPSETEGCWNLGFGREYYDFRYDYDLPLGEWVRLTLINNERSTVLCVGSSTEELVPICSFLPDENSNTNFQGVTFTSGEIVTGGIRGGSSFLLPVARLGAKAGAFTGYLDDVIFAPGNASLTSPVDDGAYDIDRATYSATDGNHQSGEGAANAIDGDSATLWHSNWNAACPEDEGWITIDLGSVKEVSGIRYLPRTSGSNGIIRTFDILVSSNGTDFTTVVENGSFPGTSGWQSCGFTVTQARYVRLLARNTLADGSTRFVSAAEIRVTFPPDLSAAGKTVVRFSESSYPLAGGKAEPEPVVLFEGTMLTKGKDYTLSWSNNTAQGTGTVTVTGAGMYKGSATAQFTISGTATPPAKPSLANATITLPQSAYVHTGEAIEPVVTVVLDGATLGKDKDYTVSYSNNVAVGRGTVTVTGIGDYTGTKSATFSIVAAAAQVTDLSSAEVTFPQSSYTYTGSPITPVPTVTLNNTELTRGADYTVRYTANTNVGTATVTVTGILNYSGTATGTFAITAASLSGATVTLPQNSYTHTGEAIRPVPTVVVGGKTLVSGTDYTVSYSGNVSVGTATVTITGRGNYQGTATKTFSIVSAADQTIDISGAAVTFPQSSYTYTGSPITPAPTVRLGGATLVRGTDYIVAYTNNTDVGTATVTITGIINYSGVTTKTFTITERTGGGSQGGNQGGNQGGSTGGSTVVVRPNMPPVAADPGPVVETSTGADGSVVERTTYPDGSTYEKITQPDGAVLENTVAADGTTTEIATEPSGVVTKTVTQPDGDTVLSLYVPSRGTTITVTDAEGEVQAKVLLPAQTEGDELTFVDVPDSHWAQAAVNTVTSLGLFKGTSDTTFSPAGATTRGMMATVLHRLSGELEKDSANFVDVAEGQYYEGAVDWAAGVGVINGVGGNKYDPDRAVTRQELAAMLFRYAGFLGADTAVVGGALGDFADSAAVPGWATNAMNWAVEQSLLKGRDGNCLAPAATASRAEVAIILSRFVDLIR